jgi:SPP1 family predicted phage head-tail adaptor
MQAGTLRHRVAIKKRDSGVDRLGQRDGEWRTVRTVWASVNPQAGQESERGRALLAQGNMQVVMRYNADVDEQCRLEFKGRTFNIGSVDNLDERNIQLTLTCSEAKDG